MPYDALTAPDPQDWLDLDEQERIDQVIDYHRRNHLPLGGNAKLHGAAHVVVENQIAMGDATAVPATFKRLMDEGLDRHEAIHAVGSVLMGIVFDVIRKVDDEANINAKYGRELAALTAASWRAQKDWSRSSGTTPNSCPRPTGTSRNGALTDRSRWGTDVVPAANVR
jgi:hypothetical protein